MKLFGTQCTYYTPSDVYLLDTGEEVLVTHPEYDPDIITPTTLEPDDSDLNQDLLESDGMKVVTLHGQAG